MRYDRLLAPAIADTAPRMISISLAPEKVIPDFPDRIYSRMLEAVKSQGMHVICREDMQ